MKNRLLSAPLRMKMVFCLILTVIIPLSLLLPLLYLYHGYAVQQEINAIYQERSYQTSEQLNMIYEQINSVSNLYFLDSDIENILRTSNIYDYPQRAVDEQKIIQLQRRYNATIPKIDLHVTIIANDNRIYGDGSYNKSVSLSKKNKLWWYQQLLQSSWQTFWIKDAYLDSLHNANGPSYIYSVRLLKRFDTWENQGILIVSFLESDLIKLYANAVPAAGSMFICNQDGTLISMVDNSNLYGSGLLDRLQSGYSASYSEEIENQDYQVVINTVRSPLWKVITVMPYQQLRTQYNESNLLIFSLVLLFLVILMVFSLFISRYIVKPIRELTDTVQEIGESEQLSSRIAVRSQDEIGLLSLAFNNMLERINHLMEAVVNEHSAKRNAELQALYAQINPHFIYNTLMSIRFLVISGENSRADTALHSFALLMRNSIFNSEDLCTIQQEINLLDKYIDIQQLFFEHPIQVVWDIAPEIRSCKIVKLSLQPIVENAVLHGLKSKDGCKILSIQAAPAGEDILITIMDNGIGTGKTFTFGQSAKRSGKNIGLENVHSRIALRFGEPYGLRFSSAPGRGAKVELLFPKIESRKEIM